MQKSSNFRSISSRVLANDWGVLTKHEFELKRGDGSWQRQTRETYDRGNGATCLLYNEETDCVLLTRQFRLPVHVNGHEANMIETPAGLLDGLAPAQRMREELIEETGFEVTELKHLFDVFMSPGSVTEYLACYWGNYSDLNKVANGGGVASEGEDIEVLHVPLPEAMEMIESGDICDGKTIILLQYLMLRKMNDVKVEGI